MIRPFFVLGAIICCVFAQTAIKSPYSYGTNTMTTAVKMPQQQAVMPFRNGLHCAPCRSLFGAMFGLVGRMIMSPFVGLVTMIQQMIQGVRMLARGPMFSSLKLM